MLLKEEDLKKWLPKQAKILDKVLVTLASFEGPCQIRQIRDRAFAGGTKFKSSVNLSTILNRSSGLALRTDKGWELSEDGAIHLQTLGIASLSTAASQVATDLRANLLKVTDPDTRSFVDEAIRCYELGCYRAAIVMSWLAALHILYRHVVQYHLIAFNNEAKRIDAKWKVAKTVDDLTYMKESDFLDRLAAISVLGKNVKEELKQRLNLRNGCGHPNSLKISANAVASHIEILLLNVFVKF